MIKKGSFFEKKRFHRFKRPSCWLSYARVKGMESIRRLFLQKISFIEKKLDFCSSLFRQKRDKKVFEEKF